MPHTPQQPRQPRQPSRPRLPVRAVPIPRHQILKDLPPDASFLEYAPEDRSDWPTQIPGEVDAALDTLGNVGIIKVSATDPGDHETGLAWLDTSAGIANSGVRVVDTYTSDQTLTSANDVVLVDASSAAVTITLPAASEKGRQFDIVKIDSSVNVVTVDANGAELINGSTDISTSIQHKAWTLVSDATGWVIL